MNHTPVTPWMSEFWTIILAIPIVLAFCPNGDDIVLRGFRALHAAPGWFEWSLAAAISLAFGIRGASSVAQHFAGQQAPSVPPQQPPAQGAGPTGATDNG